MRLAMLILPGALLGVGGCSGERDGGGADGMAPSPTTAPARSTALSHESLTGELRCAFGGGRSRPPVLIAAGDVGSARPVDAILDLGGGVVRLRGPAGFAAMTGGATFTGAGVTARVDPTGPATGGGESPGRPATLRIDGAAGSARIAGEWTCGP